MRISQIVNYCMSLPKTVCINIRCLGLCEGIKLPVFISYKVKLMRLKRSSIEINSEYKSRFMIKIGFNGTDEIASKKALLNLENGKLIFKGGCSIAEGCVISVSNGGIIEFGRDFSANKNFFISCNNHISFGDDEMLGWNVTFFDANGHPVYREGKLKENTKPISIGNHVWIGSGAHILKGANIPDGSIVAYGSLVTSELKEPDSIYGGVPAQFLQNGIKWKRHNG